MNDRRILGAAGLALLFAALVAPRLGASPVQFTLDEFKSTITMAGAVIGVGLKEQGPGSLTGSFAGSILADFSPTSIQFTAGSVLDAKTNGVWSPGPNGKAGSAPADYAAQASTLIGTVKGALRNVVLNVTSGVLPMTNGVFNASGLLFAFPTNATTSFDYDAGFLGAQGIPLVSVATNGIGSTGSVTTAGDTQTLSIQIDTEFKFKAVVENDSAVRLTGTLVATKASHPEITSITVDGQNVVLRVEGAGTNPRLDSSADLKTWATQTPAITNNASGVILTLPVAGTLQFYRVAK